MDLYYVVRVLGVDDDTFQKYLNYGQEKGCIRESENYRRILRFWSGKRHMKKKVFH